MPLKILLRRTLLAASIGGMAFFLIIILFLFFGQPVSDSYAKSVLPINSQIFENLIGGQPAASIWSINFPKQIATQSGLGMPVNLKIPKINVDANVESVGLTPGGAVGVPKNPANAAWFNPGSRPGDTGSAVITGHYGRWKNGQDSVFDNLYKLRPGDKLYVADEKGTTTTFVVRESRGYNSNAIVPEVFASSDGKAHLNLITCEGVWNEKAKQYSKRLVVFADKEEISSGHLITMTSVTPVSTLPVTCTTTATFTKFLSLKSTNSQVRSLQYLLQCLSYFPADIEPTGRFGSVTEDAVKKFQSAHSIEAAGYVGPATRSILNHYVNK